MPLTLFSFQVAGYDWSDRHWINRQVTRHTKSNINHIGIRLFIGGSAYETFVGARGSDNLLHSIVITRKYGPEIVSTPSILTSYEKVKACMDICEGYGFGKVPYAYLWWYTGKVLPPPKSCTDLACRCLQALGFSVTERALPNQLFKEVISCM